MSNYLISEEGHRLSLTLEPAPRGDYYASWILFDNDSNIVLASPSLPRRYMDCCPNEIVAMHHIAAWRFLGVDGDADALAQRFPCTCNDE